MVECTRNASCRCADCAAAMGMVSAKDLVAVASSTISWEGGEKENSTDAVVDTAATAAAPKAVEQAPKAVEQAPKAVEPATKVEVAQPQPEPSAPKAETGSDVPPESFAEKLMSSNWKFRKLAYDELRAAANSTTPDGELQVEWVEGSRAATLQKILGEKSPAGLDFAIDAIEAVCLNTTLAPDEIEGLSGKTMVAFAKKAFSGRPKTQKKMESAFLALVEIGFASQVTSMLKTLSKERSPNSRLPLFRASRQDVRNLVHTCSTWAQALKLFCKRWAIAQRPSGLQAVASC